MLAAAGTREISKLNTQIASCLFGIAFILAGLLGFLPDSLVTQHDLSAVDFGHSFAQILAGAVILVAALRDPAGADVLIKSAGIGYVLVTFAVFIATGTVLLDIVHVNEADLSLHSGLAIVFLAALFILPALRPACAQN